MAENLEQELENLDQEYSDKRAALERQKESDQIEQLPAEKETLREVVGEKMEVPEPTELEKTQQPVSGPLDLPSYERPEIKDQVQALVNTAFEKSIDQAIKDVKATHNPALLDAFHDALVDNLYESMVERGKIKEFKQAA